MKSSSIAVGNHDYDLDVHVTSPLSPKTPILVYVGQRGHAEIGSYIYTVGRGKETFSSVLQQGQDTSVQDLAVNLGRVISRKFECPSYVCMSGYFSSFDYHELAREVLSACGDGAQF